MAEEIKYEYEVTIFKRRICTRECHSGFPQRETFHDVDKTLSTVLTEEEFQKVRKSVLEVI